VRTPPAPRRASSIPDAIAPDGSEIRLLVTGEEGAARASLCEVRLPAGGVSRPVYHRSVEEIWYVLAGRGRVWRSWPGEEAAPMSVQPGDALVIPTGWRFQFEAAPSADLRFLCHTSPPWPGPDEAAAAEHGGLGQATV